MPITWNPFDKYTSVVLSNGNLTATEPTGGGPNTGARSTVAVYSGKYYWEFLIGAGTVTGLRVGVGNAGSSWGQDDGYSWAYAYDGYKHNSTGESYGNSWTTGDYIGVAVDVSAGKIWFSKNGVWQASGNPDTGANPAFTGLSGPIFAQIRFVNATNNATINLGASSFQYAAPSGFSGPDSPPTFNINTTISSFRATLIGHDTVTHIISAEVLIPVFTSFLHANVSFLSPQPTTIFNGSLPSIQGILYGGGIANFNLARMTFASTGVIEVSGSLVLPLSLSLTSTGLTAILGSFSNTISKFSLSSDGVRFITGILVPNLLTSFDSTGFTGIIGNMDFTISRTTEAFTAAIESHGNGTFSIKFGFGAEGSQTSFRAMVLNLKNNGLTEYLNYNFNSLCSFNGKYFGANTTGIYELTGTQDVSTNISWRIVTSRFDLETDNVKKRLLYAWIGCKPSGDLTLTVIQPDGTQYAYTADSVNTVDNGIRVKFGKGVKSRYVDFELKNIANESIILDKLRIFVEPTTKKR